MFRRDHRSMLPLAAGFAVLVFGAVSAVRADEVERVPPVTHAATQKECGACHLAFQPGLLPAGAWNGIMDTLSRHFGEDASLPAAVADDIRQYLTSHAGRGEATVLRISDQRWWQKEHRVGGERWTRWVSQTGVKSRADCVACHRTAAQGVYEDD